MSTSGHTNKIAILRNRIAVLDEAKSRIQAMTPADAAGRERKTELLSRIQQRISVATTEIKLRSAHSSAKTTEEKKKLHEDFKELKLWNAEIYDKSDISGISVPCVINESKAAIESVIRDELINGMVLMNNSRFNNGPRFNYRHNVSDNKYRMPPTYWRAAYRADANGGSSSMDYTTNPGVSPSDAVTAAFEGNEAPVIVECFTAMSLCYYRAILKGVGRDRFDRFFPAGIHLTTDGGSIRGLVNVGTRRGVNELKKGDWVYFHNHPNYLKRHPNSLGNAFQGENALVVGDGSYEGFGVLRSSADDMRNALLAAYNRVPTKYDPTSGQFIRDVVSDNAYPSLADSSGIPGLIDPTRSGGVVGPVVFPEIDVIAGLFL